jgi:hypothetical protein
MARVAYAWLEDQETGTIGIQWEDEIQKHEAESGGKFDYHGKTKIVTVTGTMDEVKRALLGIDLGRITRMITVKAKVEIKSLVDIEVNVAECATLAQIRRDIEKETLKETGLGCPGKLAWVTIKELKIEELPKG